MLVVPLVVPLIGLGVLAGMLTTLAGAGGGLLLLLGLSALVGPAPALASSAPALLVGNLHRSFLFRKSVDWGLARRFVTGALPGSITGAFAASVVPASWVQGAIVVTTLLSVARAVGWLRVSAPRAALAPAGFVVGGLTGSSGGAAVLTAPLLLASGLRGERYVGTAAVSAVALHVGRIAGYGIGGLMSRERLAWAAVLALAVLGGNELGRRSRHLVERLPNGLLEHLVLVACVALSLAGLGAR